MAGHRVRSDDGFGHLPPLCRAARGRRCDGSVHRCGAHRDTRAYRGNRAARRRRGARRHDPASRPDRLFRVRRCADHRRTCADVRWTAGSNARAQGHGIQLHARMGRRRADDRSGTRRDRGTSRPLRPLPALSRVARADAFPGRQVAWLYRRDRDLRNRAQHRHRDGQRVHPHHGRSRGYRNAWRRHCERRPGSRRPAGNRRAR